MDTIFRRNILSLFSHIKTETFVPPHMSVPLYQNTRIIIHKTKIQLHVHPLLGNGWVSKSPRRQIRGKKNQFLGYATILTTEVYSMWSAPFPVLGNRTANTSTIIEGGFYTWSVPKIYRGQQKSCASSRSWEAVSQGHEADMEELRVQCN
jgi:hypothetical protein